MVSHRIHHPGTRQFVAALPGRHTTNPIRGRNAGLRNGSKNGTAQHNADGRGRGFPAGRRRRSKASRRNGPNSTCCIAAALSRGAGAGGPASVWSAAARRSRRRPSALSSAGAEPCPSCHSARSKPCLILSRSSCPAAIEVGDGKPRCHGCRLIRGRCRRERGDLRRLKINRFFTFNVSLTPGAINY